MKELTFVRLEDDKECFILDEVEYNNITYVVLVNSKDKDDFIIRKKENEMLKGLKDEDEFNNFFRFYLEYKKERINPDE